MNWDLILEISGLLIGLIYLWYEYHANARVWIVSIIMPFISMWIYLRRGLYADFAINIYYVAIAVYGYIHWTFAGAKKNDDKKAIAITHWPRPIAASCVGAMLLLWGAIYFILSRFTDSNVPIPDAFTTALSIVGLWMMARKYVEQWLVWLVVDFVCVGLYVYKGIYFYAVLYSVYTVVAWFGYREWRSKIES